MKSSAALALALCLPLACTGAPAATARRAEVKPPEAPATRPGPVEEEGMTLDWSLVRAAEGGLALHYTLENTGAEPVWVLDRTLALVDQPGTAGPFHALSDRLVVRADDADPALVHLTRGRVAPMGEVRLEVLPAGRLLAPGERLEGQATLGLPLMAWHPNDGESPLPAPPTRAVFEVGLLPGTATLRDLPIQSGAAQVPTRAAAITEQRLLRGATLAIPHAQ